MFDDQRCRYLTGANRVPDLLCWFGIGPAISPTCLDRFVNRQHFGHRVIPIGPFRAFLDFMDPNVSCNCVDLRMSPPIGCWVPTPIPAMPVNLNEPAFLLMQDCEAVWWRGRPQHDQ